MPRNKHQSQYPRNETQAIIRAMGWHQTPKPKPPKVERSSDNYNAIVAALLGSVSVALLVNAAPAPKPESVTPSQLVVHAEGAAKANAEREIDRIVAGLNVDIKEHKLDPVAVEKVSGFIAQQSNGQTEFVAGNALLLASSEPGKLGPGAVIGKIVKEEKGIVIEPYTLANGDFQVGQGDQPDVEKINIAAAPERGASDPSQWNVIQVNENGQTVLDRGGFPIEIGSTPSQPSGPTEIFSEVG